MSTRKPPVKPKVSLKLGRMILSELSLPRMGVQYTKVVPDKTKYNRKLKHKKDVDQR